MFFAISGFFVLNITLNRLQKTIYNLRMSNYMRALIRNVFTSENKRNLFVKNELKLLPGGGLILDAGCGSQQYREYCSHLDYRAQDFGQYINDDSSGFTSGMGGGNGYSYGKIDYLGNIWEIRERDHTFDAILCTEVFEHIPYPNETVAEFSRLLKPGGKLILTLPSNCLRHMDPYYFYSGFSDHWIEKILAQHGFKSIEIETVGDYFNWMATELARTIKNHSFISSIAIAPALLWFLLRKPNEKSIKTLCTGYHITAIKS